MSRRIGLLLLLGGVLLALVGIVFVLFVVRQITTPIVATTPVPPPTLAVVVTTRAVPVRTVFQASDVTVVNMPVEFVPLDAVSDVDDVVGQISMIPMTAGEILMRHHLADPTNISSQNLGFIIDDDQVVMAFPATDLMSQVDVLQPGDLVDILMSVEVPVLPDETSGLVASEGQADEEEDETLFTFNALQRVTVQAIVVEILPEQRASGSATTTRSSAGGTPVPTPTPGPERIEAQAILVALSQQDALVLKHLKDAGGVADIVLRAPTSDQLFDVDPVSAEYLKDRYELVEDRSVR
jgi:Flp pilus assembly protein CpaB